MSAPEWFDPAVHCEHLRTRAACDACLHADALADPTRAPVTRTLLHPFVVGEPERFGATRTQLPGDPPKKPTSGRRVPRR